MKIYLTLFLSFLVFAGISFPQSPEQLEEQILNNIRENFAQSFSGLSDGNNAVIQQIGNENLSIINQTQIGTNPNFGEIGQNGSFNEAVISQIGSGINTVIRQRGNSNTIEQDLAGSDINTDIRQYGNQNSVEQRLSGQDLDFKVTQDGFNNEFIHIETGIQSRGFEIQQSGNGIKTYIIEGQATFINR